MRTLPWFSQLALLLIFPAIPTVVAADGRPHFVIFITDDQSQLDSSVYGATDLRTPHMQRLADSGMTFTHAFVASPSCAPSRAAMLTGLMPARNGAEPNHSRPRAEVKKLPAYLHELGYEVAAFGKVAHYNQSGLYGFDYAAAGKWLAKGNMKAAIEFLEQRKSDNPVCLFVGTHEPHVPWPRIKGYQPGEVLLPNTHIDTPETRRFRSRYYTAITEADRKFGRIYDLAREKLGPNTVFIFTSDHGAQWPFGKWNLYEAGIRVPLIVSYPNLVQGGTRSDSLVSLIDLLPTLVELAGGTPPVDIDGRSFAAVLRGESKEHREKIFTTHSGDGDFNVYPIRSVRDRQWKYILNLHPEFRHTTHINLANNDDGTGYWTSWVDQAKQDSKSAEIVNRYFQRPREELYDLDGDPHESHNLATDPDEAVRLQAMRSELENWLSSQGDELKVYGEPKLLEQEFTSNP